MAEDFIKSSHARPAFKGLYGFPNSVCMSLNEVVIHGIPTDYVLQEGDIIGRAWIWGWRWMAIMAIRPSRFL